MYLFKKFITLSLLIISFNNLSANQIGIDYEFLAKNNIKDSFWEDLETEKDLIKNKNHQNMATYIKSWQVGVGKVLHLLIKRQIILSNETNNFCPGNFVSDPKCATYANQFKEMKIQPCQVEDPINGGFFTIPDSYTENILEIKSPNIYTVEGSSEDDLFNTLIYNLLRDLLIRYFFANENYCALSHLILQPQNFMPGGLWDFYNNRISNNSRLLDTNGLFKSYASQIKQQGAPQYTPHPFSSTINLAVFHQHIAQLDVATPESIIILCACIHKSGISNPVLPSNVILTLYGGSSSKCVVTVDIRKFFDKTMVSWKQTDTTTKDLENLINTILAHKINCTNSTVEFIKNFKTSCYSNLGANISTALYYLVPYFLEGEFPLDPSLKAPEVKEKKKKSFLGLKW